MKEASMNPNLEVYQAEQAYVNFAKMLINETDSDLQQMKEKYEAELKTTDKQDHTQRLIDLIDNEIKIRANKVK